MKQKTIEELKQEYAANKKKLAQERSKLQRLNNRKAYYEKGERQKRAHRLITRGTAVESVAPLAKALTETEFYAFAEKALTVPEVRNLLMEAVNGHNMDEQKRGD
ncbi:MAG: DUF3847 domain-containing protein [Pseudoflavonifractor sp.]|nr:DUF3847 domain-containing protein [Pseudoflavonifractor sp.]MDY3019371.1 DUF3847 domain-containing protein [Oscillospiraceae bacterium]